MAARVAPGVPFAPCAKAGCKCTASWNGLPGQHCSRTCKQGTACTTNKHWWPDTPDPSLSLPPAPASPPAAVPPFAPCARAPNCPCAASWNGLAGQYCSMSCKNGTACVANIHTQPNQPDPSLSAPAAKPRPTKTKNPWFHLCSNAACPCTASYSGLRGMFCSNSCKNGTPCTRNDHSTPSKPDPNLWSRCANPACKCTASFDGTKGKFCCKTCANGTPCANKVHEVPMSAPPPPKFSACANQKCPCTSSYSGKPGDFCCKNCKRGTPCTWNAHAKPQQPAGPAAGANICLVPSCTRQTWNKQPGEFCGMTCRKSFGMAPVSYSQIPAIRKQGELWAKSVYPGGWKGSMRFYINIGLDDAACPALRKFQAGVKALHLTDTKTAEFAWHGTGSHAGLKGICWDGLDPARRSGQAYGRGEYFSVDASVSMSYASSTGYLIVCLLLKGGHNTTHNTSYRVVDNPASGNPMYCVPVGVVDYNANSDPQLKKSAAG